MTQMLVQMEAIGKCFFIKLSLQTSQLQTICNRYKLAAGDDIISARWYYYGIMVLLHLYSNITVVTIGLLLLLCVGGW